MFQTDVLSTRLAASGSVTTDGAQRARLRGVWLVPGASTGSVLFKNGGSGGATLLQIDTPAQTTLVPVYFELPGEGQLFTSSIYATISNISFVTVFWS